MTATLTIATRESPLALWQANWVRRRLEECHPGLTVKLLGMTTEADRLLEIPLTQVGGKGLFVKELETALFNGAADIAVHSMKDVPMELPAGLSLPVMCDREDPRDVLVSKKYKSLSDLPQNAIVGTSSFRRQSQINAMRPDLKIVSLRGNVNTRLNKLDRGDYAAIVLASAGLKRLGYQDRIQSYFSVEELLPAVGQGVLGIECRSDDSQVIELIEPLENKLTTACVLAERALCRYLNGGCQVPIAAFAEMKGDQLYLRGLVGKIDGSLLLRAQHSGHPEHAEAIGVQVARDLLSQGAEDILNCIPK